MKEEKLEKLLNELAEKTTEIVRPGLAEEIKDNIPQPLCHHRRGMDTINIIIDLRINKLAAAASIIITMILLANLLDGRAPTGEGIYQDGKMLVKYLLGAAAEKNTVAVRSRYERLLQKGEDVVYYGDSIDAQDSDAILMHWKLSDDKYNVIFADFREEIVTAEQLIQLQGQMLQKKTEK
jgi:hypothetical protein